MMILKNSIILILVLSFCLLSCLENQFVQGKRLYDFHCANCHMEDGKGLVKVIPGLVQSDYLEKHKDKLPCIIRNGLNGEIVVNGQIYDEPMQGFPKLTDAEISNICNYIFSSWGNNLPVQNIKQISKALENCDL